MKIRLAKKITFSGLRYDCYSQHQQIAAIVAINHHNGFGDSTAKAWPYRKSLLEF